MRFPMVLGMGFRSRMISIPYLMAQSVHYASRHENFDSANLTTSQRKFYQAHTRSTDLVNLWHSPTLVVCSPCRLETRRRASKARRLSRPERSICGAVASSPPEPVFGKHGAVTRASHVTCHVMCVCVLTF